MTHRIGIIGATGAVGRTMVRCLEERSFPVAELRLFATERSMGKVLHFHDTPIRVEPLTARALDGLDFVLMSAGAAASGEWAPEAVRRGATVVDNSSRWRLEPNVPLVVPEVNPDALARHDGIIANPNCSTIQLVVVLKPLHDAARLRRVAVATYQAVSGAGGRAMAEFEHLVASDVFNDRLAQPRIWKRPIAFNVIPWIGQVDEDGFCTEERKIMHESRKIMNLPDLRITATTVRVPVRNAHGEAVFAEFEEPISPAQAQELLSRAPGVALHADPTPLDASGRNEVFVGRIRRDPSVPSGLNLWLVADNLRKGAALNAIQILERLAGRSS